MAARYPGAAIEPFDPPAPIPDLLPVVQALGPVFGERDPDIITGQANPEGAAWFRAVARRQLAADPDGVIARLSDAEAIVAARVLADGVPDPASRRLETVIAAVRGRFGGTARGAVQGRAAIDCEASSGRRQCER
ncbi:MAG: hypothetical protein AB7G13_15520 [Lautropia sp.]